MEENLPQQTAATNALKIEKLVWQGADIGSFDSTQRNYPITWKSSPESLATSMREANISPMELYEGLLAFPRGTGSFEKDKLDFLKEKSKLDAVDCKKLDEVFKEFCKNSLTQPRFELGKFKKLKEDDQQPTFVMSPPQWPDLAHNWLALKETIEQLGAKVIVHQPKEQSKDDIYTRDAIVVLSAESKTYLTPSCEQIKNKRERSVNRLESMKAEMDKRGYKKIEVDAYFEGGDVVLDAKKKLLFIGHKPEDVEQAKQTQKSVQDALKTAGIEDIEVIMVPRQDARKYYHLDLGMARLPHGEMLVAKEMLDDKTLAVLQDKYGKELIVASGLDGHLVTNQIAIGDTLVMPACSEMLGAQLNKMGYQVVSPEQLPGKVNWNFGDVSPTFGIGGQDVGPHCMTLDIASKQKSGARAVNHGITLDDGCHNFNSLEVPPINHVGWKRALAYGSKTKSVFER